MDRSVKCIWLLLNQYTAYTYVFLLSESHHFFIHCYWNSSESNRNNFGLLMLS